MNVQTTNDFTGRVTDHAVTLRWTKVAGSWVVRVPDDTNVGPGDTLTVVAVSGRVSEVVVDRMGPPFWANGVLWRNAHPVARERSRTARYGSTGTNRSWKQTYGRCEDAPCCGCCT